MADGIPDWPVLSAGDMLRGPTTPDGPSKTAGFADVDGLDDINEQLNAFYRCLDDLPPAIERISVHPDELVDFTARFPRGEHQEGPLGSLGNLLSVPIYTDPDVPLNLVRVRRGGVDTDYPIRPKAWLWPKGYEQPDSARLVSRNPDIYRSSPLRRVPWWRRWRRR